MPDKIVVGVDIAKLKFDVAVWLGDSKYKTKVFPNTPNGFKALSAWLEPYPSCHLCMEATGIYGVSLATYLSDSGFIVSVVNPFQVHSFGKSELLRNKTDKIDAKLIARYCSSQNPSEWKPAPLSERQLQALVRHLSNLNELLRMEENRLSVADKVIHPSLHELITALKQQIAETKQKIKSHINDDPDLKKNNKLLESIPGIGAILSATLLAYIGDASRFSHSGQIVAYAGLNPKLRESGLFKGRTRISKQGSAELRKALYMPALSAISCNRVVKAQWERLLLRNKGGKVGVCAAMRKLLQLAYGVLKSGKVFDAEISLVI
ncbi:IS110 family transposase [Yersinia mollaretii]|nr:IS110 family transposase [Yersinia mollaretii]CNL51832.1 transposase for insertion sequence element IS1328 [Yersinia enterocolitica]CQR17495.1 transposase for insertion sequence element IS1328 [Yersinia mollaretii]